VKAGADPKQTLTWRHSVRFPARAFSDLTKLIYDSKKFGAGHAAAWYDLGNTITLADGRAISTERIQKPLYLHCNFVCRNLAVVPQLLGRSHNFNFRGHRILITLPKLSDVDESHSDDPQANCQSWLRVDGVDIPAEYNVYRIDLKVFLNEIPQIHPQMLVLNINQFGLLENSEQAALNAICDANSRVAIEAYEYWLSMMRWSTKSFRIGRSAVVGNASGWSPTLCAVELDKKVWCAPNCLTVEGVHRTKNEEWETVSVVLAEGKEIPPHIGLLQDAQEYNRRRDHRRSMIDIAIACEVFLRARVLSALPQGIPAAIRTSIESTNISQFVSKFFPDLLTSTGKSKFSRLSKELTSLFDARNKIMHMDNNERATSEQCVRFIGLANKLFDLDNYIFSSGVPLPAASPSV